MTDARTVLPAVLAFALAGCAGRVPVPGTPAGGSCVPAAAWVDPATRALLPEEAIVDAARRRRIVLLGESLGGAIAAHLAKDVAPRALITVSAFSSVPDLAADVYWFLPVRLLARFDYATARFVSAVRAPVLFVHSRDDEIVPFSHAETLFAQANEPRQLLEIRGDHNTGFIVSARALEAGIGAFLERHPAR